MKSLNKFLVCVTACVCAFICTLSFAACGDNGDNSNSGGDGGTHTKHNWSTTYTPDGDRHYQTCDGCTEKNYSNHDYGTSGVCVCGKTKPAEAHTKHNWSTAYTNDGDRHYQTCDGCTEKQYSNHDYGTSGVCVCGKQKPENPDTPTKYTVTFEPNGGTFANGESTYSVQVNEGEKVSPVTVTRGANYKFLGWFIDEDHTELWDFENDTVTKVTTLYAGWEYENPYQSLIDALQKKLESITNKADGTPVYKNAVIIDVFDINGVLCFATSDEEKYTVFIVDVEIGTTIENAQSVDLSLIPQAEMFDIHIAKRGAYSYDQFVEETEIVSDIIAKILGDGYTVVFGTVSTANYSTEHRVNNRIGRQTSFSVNALIVKDGKIFDFSTQVFAITDNDNYTAYDCVLKGICSAQYADWGADYGIECAFYTTFNGFSGTNYGEEYEDQPYMLKDLGVIGADFYAEWKKEQEVNQNIVA